VLRARISIGHIRQPTKISLCWICRIAPRPKHFRRCLFPAEIPNSHARRARILQPLNLLASTNCTEREETWCATSRETTQNIPQGHLLKVLLKGNGKGRVTGSPGSIECVTDCLASFSTPTRVTLRAIPALGSAFIGWRGDGSCTSGVVLANASTSCVAMFEQ
jgi:hypothetical protein